MRIRGRHAVHGQPGLVVLAHPAVIGQDYEPLTELAEMLYADFDIVTFDFRGHGRSGGFLTPDLRETAADLAAVLDHLRRYDYAWTGVAGFSLGGM
ncbi:MAG: alpha/beta hydrolase, partial [Actinobacteria bacterium]|nr:alpha/beta hydrolase [Actinomycetota bacterium]